MLTLQQLIMEYLLENVVFLRNFLTKFSAFSIINTNETSVRSATKIEWLLVADLRQCIGFFLC